MIAPSPATVAAALQAQPESVPPIPFAHPEFRCPRGHRKCHVRVGSGPPRGCGCCACCTGPRDQLDTGGLCGCWGCGQAGCACYRPKGPAA